jgi:hypothetical protein
MTTGPQPLVSVYLSYVQQDKALKQEFEDYLIILQQNQVISGWVERQIQQRKDWSQDIDPRSSLAKVFVLLVSPSLLASGYCAGAEFGAAFASNKPPRHMALVPILLHATNLRGHVLDSILWLPRNQLPVSAWAERRDAWWSIDTAQVRELPACHEPASAQSG